MISFLQYYKSESVYTFSILQFKTKGRGFKAPTERLVQSSVYSDHVVRKLVPEHELLKSRRALENAKFILPTLDFFNKFKRRGSDYRI